MQNRTSNQVTELQNLAEIQFSRANRLGDELNKIRKDNKDMRRKVCLLTSIDPSRLIAFLGFSLLRCASNFYFVMDLFSFFLHKILLLYTYMHFFILFLLLYFWIIISNTCRFHRSLVHLIYIHFDNWSMIHFGIMILSVNCISKTIPL